VLDDSGCELVNENEGWEALLVEVESLAFENEKMGWLEGAGC
jgi:hypothetical protein